MVILAHVLLTELYIILTYCLTAIKKKIVNFPFLDGNVPRPLPMLYTFHNLFVLQEYVLMLMTSTTYFRGGISFVDHLCYLCLVFVMLSRLFIAAVWSPAGKGLTSWLLFVMFKCIFVTFPCGILLNFIDF